MSFFAPPPGLKMTLSVYEAIRDSIGNASAETGGMLGGDFEKNEITHFFYDNQASRSAAAYSPDTVTINDLLTDVWNPTGVRLLGFAHSHPPGICHPSRGDEIYAERILSCNTDAPFIALPIVQSEPDVDQFQIRMFVARRNGAGIKIDRIPFMIVADSDARCGYDTLNRFPLNKPAMVRPRSCETTPPVVSTPRPRMITPSSTARKINPVGSTFDRVAHAYDLQHLAACRFIYIGAGGAAGFIEDMARAGLGEHVLIDPDVVSETNLATQQVYRKDIGRPKVACIAERVIDINPGATVIARQKSLDEMSDNAFREFAFTQMPGNPPPADVVLCGLTDNFQAQARVNRLGLNFGLPTLCAQVYAEGRAAEITFTYPGVTPACHRCILSARYDAYLKNGFENNVSSNGTPIFATTRLNAIKGFVAMAILHHGRHHPRWGGMLWRIGNRNLIQVRLDPDVESLLGIGNFEQALAGARGEQLFFDETIWRPQLQECPATGYAIPCPDCGGTGDLRFAIARFADTRLISGSNNESMDVP
jgi:proteasome lid subunit RPN8/RPN11